METTTSFDLSRAIQQWRENLAQSPVFRTENIHELESHLRDSIATLQTRELSAEEAFVIATRRIGKGGALETEFAKVNRRDVWLDRALWMLIGVQIWGLAMDLTGSVARNALSWGWASTNYSYKENGLALPVALFSLTHVLVLAASLVLCWWLVVRKGEKLGARLAPLLLRRSTLIATGTGLCLLLLIARSLSFVMQILLIRSVNIQTYAPMAQCLNYSQFYAWPIQAVTLMILTLAIARKRLPAKQVFD